MQLVSAPREILTITNPNRAWVVDALDELLAEWREWLRIAQSLPDSPDYHPMTCTEAIKDGFDNRRKHEVLREKTLVFIGNHFSGYGFLFHCWPEHPHESNICRLSATIPEWVTRLEMLSSCIIYARVMDGFWTAQAKRLVNNIRQAAPDKVLDVGISWLKNPFQQ